ncbi:MAG: HU family DNA-binding protein [Anaerolineales bacterium]
MTVKYNVVERPNPLDREAPKKFYPSIHSSGRKSLRQLTGRITQMCTVSSADTLAVLESFLTIIPQELAEGNIVELGDFGSFWLRSNSEGSEQVELVTGNQVKSILPRFIPGKEFKKALATVDFVKAPQNQ